ncbi:AmmeMemoRadiSam system radical SAM enzyme [Clostridium polyendosporum]|uniref:AmmeMemoRadiSam system radical SAM enzyme n=1 Tax=Clostridium polyendosporum TaxID=69208 RepID=A0A919S2U9_9CLOT|nr:AmmeMemoRadiSam system radical SAM enzyme [Clostridium polyendosporum]GIM29573.1 AmmeMemoRadiSam system radical SAM enzyme [Clostridium polyendosporum]
MNKEALFYKKKENGTLGCKLCPHTCVIQPGGMGLCGVRQNKEGMLYTLNYGEVTSIALDPIEKKPLYHFYPGKNILSIGSFGCNFKCSFCQNYSISQYKPKSEYLEIEKLVSIINETENNIGVAFTYNEPSIWYEYIFEASKTIKERNKKTKVVIITNGYISEEPLLELLPFVDAMNIDLKGWNESYYSKVCNGKRDFVLNTINKASEYCHVEITTLLVEGENTSLQEIEEISKFLSSININIPLHLSRYYPNYKMTNEPTSIDFILNAEKLAKKHLNYVYVGNVQGIDNSTYCHQCKEKVIDRTGYVVRNTLKNSNCPNCGERLPIIY